jgi:hypothetical protein
MREGQDAGKSMPSDSPFISQRFPSLNGGKRFERFQTVAGIILVPVLIGCQLFFGHRRIFTLRGVRASLLSLNIE